MTDDELLRRPVIIVGAPRSGTAIVAHVVRAHPDMAYLREPRLLWRHGNDTRSDLLTADDARPEVRAWVRGKLAEAVREQGRRRLTEKTPSNSLRLPFVDVILPDARFVHVIRNGPDSIASIRRSWLQTPRGVKTARQKDRLRRHLREIDLQRMRHYAGEFVRQMAPARFSGVVGPRLWGPRLPGIDGLVRDLDLLEVCALQWRMCVELACQAGRRLGPDRYFECRVEDLTPGVLKEIVDFCELGDAPQVWAAFESEYEPAKIHEYGKDLTAEELRRVMDWIEPTLAWLHDEGDQRSANR